MDQENRRKLMLRQEGAILSSVACNGISTTCEIARCQIDGLANALIRIEGAEETALFIFALSDRVAGGIRENTDHVAGVLTDDEIDLAFDQAKQVEAAESRLRWLRNRHFFAWGFLAGLPVMMGLTMLSQGKP